jgi:hypothetical protein
MKRFRNKSFAGFLILAFSFAAMFCCCLTNTPQAQALETLPPCHQTASSETDNSPVSQECDCEKQLRFTAVPSAVFSAVDLMEDFNFSINAVTKTETLSLASLFSYGVNSPPGLFIASLPIYLKNSNLRL